MRELISDGVGQSTAGEGTTGFGPMVTVALPFSTNSNACEGCEGLVFTSDRSEPGGLCPAQNA